jgi:hypothetical protein
LDLSVQIHHIRIRRRRVRVEKFFRNSGHLIRPAVVLLAGLGAFLVIRGAVVPKGFGQYGHYRPGALATARQHAIAYAGQAACVECHEDEGKLRASGKHAHVACETCHGPLARHAVNPTANVPKLPDVATLCARCHERDTAKPKAFPQVVTAEHSGGMACNECHKPHSPHL